MLVPAAISAHDVSDCLSRAGLSCAQMKVTICPAGDFEYIATGCGAPGGYIWIEARDNANNPVPGIPRTDYWLNACNSRQQLFLCGTPIVADSMTGANGRARLTCRVAGGGCVLSQGIYVAIQGKVIKYQGSDYECIEPLCLNIVIKGPDLTGAGDRSDGVVNLLDFSRFGLSLNKASTHPEFNPCCDFNDDNLCNLSDFAPFRQHYQHRCQ